ncbi:hypothetical protein GGTG_09012 [Gaeumannomyces tritici R3-111a-1]|uniref:ubiquitinyl hydrolase 1 n=1 Tax=Gaeumannomyces tritici (strain R3-111a-1) TaxID=644352 RepID=J3P671_GAET3|nr:hypothetical protein GGTG_09012 [Gaeumannomyces tritici R3-111a-1]EJT72145.1 hypothetical protein GGTG_09012 [Gaeumannomyces tritici R3-111a-1]
MDSAENAIQGRGGHDPIMPAAAEILRSAEKLGRLIEVYWEAAAGPYRDNPEALSVMHLAIMELWITIDDSTANLVPLLRDYDTGFLPGLLDDLVLPKREQMARLARVEDYLERRRVGAGGRGPPWQLRSGDGSWSKTCFAARYYDSSPRHRQLCREIVCEAKTRITELRIVEMTRHPRLLWPLPKNDTAAKAIVFEAAAPAVITTWREITLSILTGLCGTSANMQPESRWVLYRPDDHPIIKDVAPNRRSGQLRFQLARDCSKQWASSVTDEYYFYCSGPRAPPPRLGRVRLVTDEYYFYDTCRSRNGFCRLPTSFLPVLRRRQGYPPDATPQILREWILGTAHTANSVLAALPHCPDNMTPNEFRAFGGLRAGPRLQWYNILLQLLMPSLDLNRPEVFFLVMQAAHEVGPRGGEEQRMDDDDHILRSTHAILGEGQFAKALHLALEEALGRIMTKQGCEVALCILVGLGARLLSVSRDRAIQAKCLGYLRWIRDKSIGWARDFDTELRESGTADGARRHSSLGWRARMMALICHATFDVGAAHMRELLSDDGSAAVLIEASIRAAEHAPHVVAQEGTAPNNDGATRAVLDVFRHRSRRLSYEVEHQLRAYIVDQGSSCLDQAVQAVWPSYAWRAVWAAEAAPYEHVLVASPDALSLRYDLLTGSLSVGGLPFTTFPASFCDNATYRRLLGHAVFTVVPSHMWQQGMQYMTTSKHHDHELHFAMVRGGGDQQQQTLVVRSEKDGIQYELIPAESLRNDFPRHLVTDYTHWFAPDKRYIEFRPLDRTWQTRRDTGPAPFAGYVLHLSKYSDGPRFSRAGESRFAINVRSETANAVYSILWPLEPPCFIEMAWEPDRAALDIALPRLHLSFRLGAGGCAVTSVQYKGYAIDASQHIGTLSGLETKLVLRRTEEEPGDRLVLIPLGSVSFTAGAHGRAQSTKIDVTTGRAEYRGLPTVAGRAQYHAFSVDTVLGCLRDDGTLSSKLLLCQLHAMTTHCLPDRLTGRTGTDEALRILGSAAVRSLLRDLPPRSIDFLHGLETTYAGAIAHMKVRSLLGIREPPSPRDGDGQPLSDGDKKLRDVIRDLPDAYFVLLRRIYSISPRFEECGLSIRWSASAPRTAQSDAFSRLVSGLAGMRPESDMIESAARRRAARMSAYVVSQYDNHQHHSAAAAVDDIIYESCRYPELSNRKQRYPKRDRYDWELDTCAIIQVIMGGSNDGSVSTAATAGSPSDPGTRGAGAVARCLERLINALLSGEDDNRGKAVSGCLAGMTICLSEWPTVASTDGVAPAPAPELARKRIGLASIEDMFTTQEPPQPIQQHPNTDGPQRHLDVLLARCGERSNNERDTHNEEHKALGRLCSELRDMSSHKYERGYVDMLEQSVAALRERPGGETSAGLGAIDEMARELLLRHREACRIEVAARFAAICSALVGGGAGNHYHSQYPSQVARLPVITPMMLLERLSRRHRAGLPEAWRRCLVDYAVSLTSLQRAGRLVRAAAGNDGKRLARELGNVGHEGWDPFAFPDWLLLEVERDLLIRPVQAHIARAMIEPPDGRSCVMQLNMGEGKSSVIMPMVAAAIADDGSRLARVVVARPQRKQMMHTLSRALGGLLGRHVHQMPLARGGAGTGFLKRLHAEYLGCVSSGGVVLAQHENMLSLRLSCIEAMLRVRDRVRAKHTLAMKLPMLGALAKRTLVSMLPRRADTAADWGEWIVDRMDEFLEGLGSIVDSVVTEMDAAASAVDQAEASVGLQRFLDSKARDVIDESDEILGTRSELVYTMGLPSPPDLSPLRWQLIQSVLGLVADIACDTVAKHPDEIELVPGAGAGSFPTVRILNERGADMLTRELGERICALGALPEFPYAADKPRQKMEAIQRYMTQYKPDAEDVAAVETIFATDDMRGRLLLLRGLIAHGVLSFSLRQRWRVNYGRTDTREPPTGLAVPFRAKDLPAPRSEFSHPDVLIALTCLSYYYGGLSDDDLFCSIERLFASGQGEQEYLSWVRAAPDNIPHEFHRLSALDLGDRGRCAAAAFPHLRHLKPAIDYYLGNVLFTREMHDFSQKLSGSAWSLVAGGAQRLPGGGAALATTTGFSGTHDAGYLLPLGIKTLDLKTQRHTDALVLGRLLRPENKVRDLAPSSDTDTDTDADTAFFFSPDDVAAGPDPSSRARAMGLVNCIIAASQPPVRVIIDAGAQIIELDNAEIARGWLARDKTADAAVFFDSHGDLRVVARGGATEPFLTSSYAMNMAPCLVFLDEAHARGTDLALPDDYRAAVTLGPALTKDKLVQACMRMRELGRGQSVVFFAPAEVRHGIRTLREIPANGDIEVADVLAWSISETWRETRLAVPTWAAQGRRHQRQRRLWQQADKGNRYGLGRDACMEFLETEVTKLSDQYRPGGGSASSSSQTPSSSPLTADTTDAIQARCEEFGVVDQRERGSRPLGQEQERELLVEREEERVEEKPATAKAVVPRLHADVEAFVMTGVIPKGSRAFKPAFRTLAGTSAAGFLGGLRFPPDLILLATADFGRTVTLSEAGSPLDAYQRSVQWIATAPAASSGNGGGGGVGKEGNSPRGASSPEAVTVVLLSPWEANALMPAFEAGRTAARLHLFAPRTSLHTRSAENLQLYVIPSLPSPPPLKWQVPRELVIALLLFAGQLYLRSHEDYVYACEFLGVPHGSRKGGAAAAAAGGGGFFGPAALSFLAELFGRIRHPATDISSTDVGHILAGKVLPESAFSWPPGRGK